MTERRRHTARDRERTFTFVGEVLGHASTLRDGQPRWFEITIYRTEAGRYVVAGVGQTLVTNETPRYWAHVTETAEGAITALYQYDEHGIRYLTRASRRAIHDAAAVDDDIRRAFLVEEVA